MFVVVVNALVVLLLELLNVLGRLQHLLPLLLLAQVVEVRVQALPQPPRLLILLLLVLLVWIISDELGGRVGAGGNFVDLGGHGDGGDIHGYVLAVESAAEWSGAGVCRGGASDAEVAQSPLHVGRRGDETT